MTRRTSTCAALLALWLLAPAAFAQLQRKPLPVPDVAGYKTLKCDFHMHSVFSDGLVWPVIRVHEAWRGGLDAISITDHDDYHPHDPHVSTDIAEPYRIARARAEELGILLVPGIEITKGEWHFNALFVKDFNATKKLGLAEALREARRQGAFVFWNHPGWKRPERWFEEIAPLHAEGLFQGFELVNGRTVYAGGFSWMAEKNLAVLANTDIHAPMTETEEDGRAITLVFVRSADLEGLREALMARRTVAWMGGQLWGPEPWLRGLWEGAIRLETPSMSVAKNQRTAQDWAYDHGLRRVTVDVRRKKSAHSRPAPPQLLGARLPPPARGLASLDHEPRDRDRADAGRRGDALDRGGCAGGRAGALT